MKKRSSKKRPRSAASQRGMVQYNSRIPMVRYPQVEKKYLDWFLTGQPGGKADASNVYSFFSALAMAQGAAPNERVGKKITLRNINIRGDLAIRLTTRENVGLYARVALVLDTQFNGGVPGYDDVYSRPSSTANVNAGGTGVPAPDGTHPPLWLRNMSTVRRFKVLKEKLITLNPSAMYNATDVLQANKTFKMSWRGALPIYYEGADDSVANITSNNVCLFIAADQQVNINGTADSAPIGFTGVMRVKFTDL